MSESELPPASRICHSCGLCCNGTIFRRARLKPEEVESAKKNRLPVVESGETFDLPCPRFDSGSCTIYPERPQACQDFKCALLMRFHMGGTTVEEAVADVSRAKHLIAQLEAKGMDMSPEGNRSITSEGDDAYEVMALASELMHRMDRDFRRAESIGEGAPPPVD